VDGIGADKINALDKLWTMGHSEPACAKRTKSGQGLPVWAQLPRSVQVVKRTSRTTSLWRRRMEMDSRCSDRGRGSNRCVKITRGENKTVYVAIEVPGPVPGSAVVPRYVGEVAIGDSRSRWKGDGS